MSGQSSERDLGALREEMDAVTLEMVRLLSRRSGLARRIGEAKRGLGAPVDDAAREGALRSKVVAACAGEGEAAMASRLLNFLINESVQVQSAAAPPAGASHTAIFQEAKRLEEEGRDIVHMEVGEPDSAPPERVAAALAAACAAGHTKYGTAPGIAELRDAAAETESAHGTPLTRDNIVVTMGARFAIYLAIESLLSPGDELVVIEPAWPAYAQCAMRAGVKVSRIRTTLESRWEPDISEIESAITPNTKMIAINYPNNPTGKVLPARRQGEIMDLAARRSLYVLSDEIYAPYSLVEWHSALESGHDRTIVTQSLSKSHAMTGFRVGYAVAPQAEAQRMARLQSLCLTCVPTPVQHAALAALRAEPPGAARETLERLRGLAPQASRAGLEFDGPDGAMYVFGRLPRGLDGGEVAMECLRRGLAIAPGAGFGGYGPFVRLSACREAPVLARGMDILNSVISGGGA